MSRGHLSDLMGLAYDAAFDASLWPIALNRIADSLAATSGAAIVSYNAQTRRRGLLYPMLPRNMSAASWNIGARAAPFCIRAEITRWRR